MNLFEPKISREAMDNVAAVLASGRLSEGEWVKKFEAALSARLGLSRPLALNSGTSALHLALVTAGVGPGDEVILPAQTFIATGLVVLMQGATPVFADIDPKTGNIAPESVRLKITAKTRAIMPVHWAGLPCDLDELASIARENRVILIEDAAHALGATYGGRPVGSISRFTAFSFQAIKHLTTGDGGALAMTEEADWNSARRLRWFGIDRDALPTELGERDIDIAAMGFKYHMNDLAASLGAGNIEAFLAGLDRRRRIDAAYRARFAGMPGVRLLEAKPDRVSACWVFTLRVAERLKFVRALRDRSVPASVLHHRIDRYSVFGGIRRDLPGQDIFDDEQISIPCHEHLSDEDVDRVMDAVRAGW